MTLRACYFPTQDFLPHFVIREQGLDKEHGLQLESRAVGGGAAAIGAMLAGSLDICTGVGTVPLISAAERGLIPGTIIAVAANNVADEDHRAVGVLAGPLIRRWHDLQGRRIAVNARDSIGAAALVGRLTHEGVGDYTLVEIPFANVGLAVAGGNVAAASMSEPFLTQSLLRGDGPTRAVPKGRERSARESHPT